MKKNIRTRIMGTVLATICAISATAAVSTVGASAASVNTASVSAQAKTGKPCAFTMKGCNWNYSADSTYAKISCDFNYSTKTCRFIARGTSAGVTNAILKAKRSDGKWDNVPIRFTVDRNLNVTGQQTGKYFITNN